MILWIEKPGNFGFFYFNGFNMLLNREKKSCYLTCKSDFCLNFGCYDFDFKQILIFFKSS